TAWVQPPGTPIVGGTFLDVYERTGDKYYLAAAKETAYALVAGQLKSGGWDYRIEYDPKDRRRYAYRIDGDNAGSRNVTTLDDNNTQSALRFLMRTDRTLQFKDQKIHEAVEYALESLLKAQYPNGSWPQRFSEFPDPEKHPVKKASYPKTWSRVWPSKDYRGYYTFNDNSIADVIDTMFDATEIYGEERFQAAAEKAGDFMILAQMPDPQPGWAQQYDADMHPAWARKFEPASVTGGESQGVMRSLLKLYRRTGKKKFLEPIPRALAYYKKSLLPDGRLARFYELKTNRPLYFVKDTYELTYSSDNMPTHYGFITGSRLDSIEAEYRRLQKTDPSDLNPPREKPSYRLTSELSAQAKAVVGSLDSRGAWVEEGRLRSHGADDPTRQILNTRTFINNVSILSRFLAASRAK
ncbi:MAG: polysaccharide lyase, partial [Planctomycetes bacterium]|nr:polysaccharide lyase [Planctomycetota bacterium]